MRCKLTITAFMRTIIFGIKIVCYFVTIMAHGNNNQCLVMLIQARLCHVSDWGQTVPLWLLQNYRTPVSITDIWGIDQTNTRVWWLWHHALLFFDHFTMFSCLAIHYKGTRWKGMCGWAEHQELLLDFCLNLKSRGEIKMAEIRFMGSSGSWCWLIVSISWTDLELVHQLPWGTEDFNLLFPP